MDLEKLRIQVAIAAQEAALAGVLADVAAQEAMAAHIRARALASELTWALRDKRFAELRAGWQQSQVAFRLEDEQQKHFT